MLHTEQFAEVASLVRELTGSENGVSLDARVAVLESHRQAAGQSRDLDRALLAETVRLRSALDRAGKRLEGLQAVLDKLSSPPLHPAVFLAAIEGEGERAAMVVHNDVPRVVSVADDVDIGTLRLEDEVLLGPQLNVLLRRSHYPARRAGEIAVLARRIGPDRAVLQVRGEDIVATLAPPLCEETLTSGAQLRWHRKLGLAFEQIERASDSTHFLEDTPAESFDQIGGLESQIEAIRRVVLLHAEHPEIAERYGLARRGSVLLVGPPGTGKTLLARALAGFMASRAKSGRSRFMNIKPGALHSSWYAQSEANYREVFRVAREAGAADPDTPVIMFFDEIDAVGSARGGVHSRVDDRVLTALMTELDGLERRGNILVVAATNRRDALDPALLRPGRLGDLVLHVERPGRSGARAIFQKHLQPDVPTEEGGDTRDDLVESGVSTVFAPNALGSLARLTLRDGRTIEVYGKDLVSGAIIAQAATDAKERACVREAESGLPGVRATDLRAAVRDALGHAARSLAPGNCHRFLADLPQDVDVVKVEHTGRAASDEADR